MITNVEEYEKLRKSVIRGETLPDISSKCLKVCADYLGGVWGQIDEKKIIVTRITGGFTNQLYYCGLTEDCKTSSNEPKEVAVRFYGEKWFVNHEENERINDVILTILTSEHNLGAKLYGVFNGGQIIEYIKSHQFGINDQNNAELVEQLSRILARFHSLKVPMTRAGNWYFKLLDEFYLKAYELFPIDELLRELNATTFLNTNLKEEIEWLKECLKATNSPIVFSHNDFRGSNILVRELHNNQSSNDSNTIRLCDFDGCSYSYRGFAFGSIFEDWGKNDTTITRFPSDLIIEKFMETYLDECVRIHGENYRNNELNSMQQLVKEAKVFALAQQMCYIMFILRCDELPFNLTKKQYLVKGEERLSRYLQLKKRFQNEGLIPIST